MSTTAVDVSGVVARLKGIFRGVDKTTLNQHGRLDVNLRGKVLATWLDYFRVARHPIFQTPSRASGMSCYEPVCK